MWSRKYKVCVSCGKTDRRHKGKGLCRRCHAHRWSNKEKRDSDRFGGLREAFVAAHPNCEVCGLFSNIVVHHCDGNRKHNYWSNFSTLCRSCHTALHNYVRLTKRLEQSMHLVQKLIG